MRKPCCCDRGACCNIDETCEITTQENCEEQCGVFQGIGIPCLQCDNNSDCFEGQCVNGECNNGVDCTFERGACCFCEPDFTDCVDDLTQPECEQGESSRTCVDGVLVIEYEWEQGVWQGPNHTCNDSCDCQDGTGSCCVEGVCRDNYTSNQCTNSGYFYYGDGTSCFPDAFSVGSYPDGEGQPLPIDPLGSCCIITLDNAPYHSAICFNQSTQQGCDDACTDPSSSYYGDECTWYEVPNMCTCNCIGGSQEEDWCCFGGSTCPNGLYCLGSGEGGNEQISVGTCQECCDFGPCEQDSDCEENLCCVDGMCVSCGCSNDSDCLGENLCCYGGNCMGCIGCVGLGACCVNQEQCIRNVTEEECSEIEGVFQGEGSIECVDCGQIVGNCCVPNGTPSDILEDEYGICLGTVVQGTGYRFGCPAYDDGDPAYDCYEAESCCRTGVWCGEGTGEGSETWYVGITEEQCISIEGANWFTGPDPDELHSDGYHECVESGCGGDEYGCVCRYSYCTYTDDQDCGAGMVVSECGVETLSTNNFNCGGYGGLGPCRDAQCQQYCKAQCMESGGDEDACSDSGFSWEGVKTGICSQGGADGEPLTCEDINPEIPNDACILDDCPGPMCCCYFPCPDGEDICIADSCENLTEEDCTAFGGDYVYNCERNECPNRCG